MKLKVVSKAELPIPDYMHSLRYLLIDCCTSYSSQLEGIEGSILF
jgi:hypothetical protein